MAAAASSYHQSLWLAKEKAAEAGGARKRKAAAIENNAMA